MLPHHCNSCNHRRNGFDTCHCAGCHVTLTSIRAFDRHRRDGQCQPPATVGLVQSVRSYECWQQRDERPHPFSLLVSAPDGSEILAEGKGTGEVANGADISEVA